MADRPETVISSTPEASAAVAQDRRQGAQGTPSRDESVQSKILPYCIGPGVTRAARIQLYQRKKHDPLYRPLKIFSLDPAIPKAEGAIAVINVPYEPLQPGPKGAAFEVEDRDATWDVCYRAVDLDDPVLLMQNGRAPSAADPLFHQQMSYAVCSSLYAAFRTALGRDIPWGFDAPGTLPMRLRIRPHAQVMRNAYYDKEKGEICFGYDRSDAIVQGPNLPYGWTFTCLSHDVLAHEVTHAILDGLRAHFTHPSGLDVLAFHEAFADLSAIFQHFAYREVVHAAIKKSRGDLHHASLLTDLAVQFGHTTGAGGPLRTAIDVTDGSQPPPSHKTLVLAKDPHALGSLLVSAVFEAFTTVFQRKTRRYVRLATGGSGILPAGELPADLSEILAKEASQLASQFLNICIRAIDYCPPVDLEFGDFLRAVITADSDLIADDHWGYREAWIDAFRRRGIYPRHVSDISEDALIWRPPTRELPELKRLSFAELKFAGDPGRPAGEEELKTQAVALGEVISTREHAPAFGLTYPGHPKLNGDEVAPPCVQSIRSSRRTGPDGQLVFDLIAEITQHRRVKARNNQPAFDFYGGSTVILSPNGDIRYVVLKNILSEERVDRQRAFLLSDAGRRYWRRDRNACDQSSKFFACFIIRKANLPRIDEPRVCSLSLLNTKSFASAIIPGRCIHGCECPAP